jgi:TetR/AcrR family transcriptional regulator, transcriptional repressor for nem operon
MPYTPEHKAETRKRIVESARRLFNRHGFTGVSIDEIMAEAGLTRGGFYNHFDTKEELYAEVVTQALSCDPGKRWPELEINRQAPARIFARQIVNAYLSKQHLEDREGSCPLMALPSDVARGGEPVKRAYSQVLAAMVAVLERGLRANGSGDRTQALAIASLCIGGMAVARAVDDARLANEVREAAKAMALSLGGWDEVQVAAE